MFKMEMEPNSLQIAMMMAGRKRREKKNPCLKSRENTKSEAVSDPCWEKCEEQETYCHCSDAVKVKWGD